MMNSGEKLPDSHTMSSVDDCRIIDLPRHSECNGALSVLENNNLPFAIRRVYYLYDIPANAERGGHSHYRMQSMMVAAGGSFVVEVTDGAASRRFTLNRPWQALYIPAGIWRTVREFSSGSVCLNIVSDEYDEADYVRDYDDFLKLTEAKRSSSGFKYPFLNLATVNKPYLKEIKEAALRVIDSGRYIGGTEVEALETEMSTITGAPYAIGVSNGLDALRLIFRAYIITGQLRYGDEVIIPADTFIASALAVTDCGLVPVFADPDPDTFNLSAESIQKALTPRTRAILPVHLYGRICWNEDMRRIVMSRQLLVIEDSAQAIGAVGATDGLFTSRAAGGIGHAAGFSFYPTKNIGALGDAGMVTTHDRDLADIIRSLRNYGSSTHYHNIYTGCNCRLDPIQAAIILAKLPHLQAENEHRRKIASIYTDNIHNPKLKLPPYSGTASEVWHQYTVLADDREHFRKYLANNGVETAIHYPIPVHLQPCYRQYADLDLPAAEYIAGHIVSLPVSPCTSAADALAIAAIINSYR